MDSPRVLVGFGRWPKCGWMLSIVVKIMPLGAKQTEVAAVFERTELQAIGITNVTRFSPY